jgi:hypothetical protein
MAGFLSWVQSNWSAAVGAVGIIASLLFTAGYFREDSKNRHVSNLLAIEERHRALWSEAQKRHDLKRIFADKANVLAEPVSADEDMFLRRIILHFETGWRLEKIMSRGEMNLLARDVADFFKRPLPHAVWEKTKRFRNWKFVRFVERAIKRPE